MGRGAGRGGEKKGGWRGGQETPVIKRTGSVGALVLYIDRGAVVPLSYI